MNLPLPRRNLDPFGDLAHLWNRMGHVLDPFGNPFGSQDKWVPMVETEEDGETYVVRAELPGMRRENIDVELGGGELRITGETTEEEGGPALRRRHGRFAYHTTVPADTDIDRAEARLAHGVLTVRLPKSGQSRSRKLEVMGDSATV